MSGTPRIYLEAEDFDHNQPDPDTGTAWRAVTDSSQTEGTPFFQNFVGEGYLQLLPDTGQTFDIPVEGARPYVEYELAIETPGTYQLYARWDGYSAQSDSFYASIPELRDGPGDAPDWYRFAWNGNDHDFQTDQAWHGDAGFELDDAGGGDVPAIWGIERPGTYTLRINGREDGAAIDAFILWNWDFGSPVAVDLASEPIFVGSYVNVPIQIDPASNLALSDLEFVVTSGSDGGIISNSQENRDDIFNPSIMLLAGHQVGLHELLVLEKSSGTLLAATEFELTTFWPGEEDGPSQWVWGDYQLPGISGAAWGGGSPTEPENYDVIPVSGTRDVAILLVDTSSQRYDTAEVATLTDTWEDLAFNGRDVNGRTVSTAHYYREVSFFDDTTTPVQGIDLEGQVFGPIHLPGSWNDYLHDDGNYHSNIWQACASAGDSLVDFSQFEHLVCVVQSVDATATTPQKRVWAHADSMVADVAEGKLPLSTVVMPADGGFESLSSILAHELGHNLGLGDIYSWGGHTQAIQDRELFGMALMARGTFADPVLVHRMKLGWVPKADIQLYNFQTLTGSLDETVTLQAIELADPPAGQYSGIEVRIAPNWNYYFEYRAAQNGQVGDQSLWWPNGATTGNHRVLGTDVTFGDDIEAASRRKPVMALRDDVDGDGPILDVNDDYAEQDISDPNFPTDFTITVLSSDDTKANVRIQYGVTSQPDPSIRPWNPPVYQSPDIEVRNARNQADPKWKNVPWEKHINTLAAQVTNRGQLNAPGVWVDFYVKDYTVNSSGTQPIWIGSDQQDIPAQGTVEFTSTWHPKKAGHYCVEARVRLYQTPGPNSVIEVTEFNNRAQSNYDRFISSTASAPSREVATFEVRNPYNEPIHAILNVAAHSNPLYRTYLEHRWIELGPGETKDVRALFEYGYEEDPIWDPLLEAYLGLPNDVSIYATLIEPGAEPEQDPIVLGGLTAQVVTGRATHFDSWTVDPNGEGAAVSGQVVTIDSHDPVDGGFVVVTYAELAALDGLQELILDVNQDGEFQGQLLQGTLPVAAYYVPAHSYSDCELILLPLELPGDYNGNTVVDQADYGLWKETFGSTTILDADGNRNGVVDAGDFTVWKDNLGGSYFPDTTAAVIQMTRGAPPAAGPANPVLDTIASPITHPATRPAFATGGNRTSILQSRDAVRDQALTHLDDRPRITAWGNASTRTGLRERTTAVRSVERNAERNTVDATFANWTWGSGLDLRFGGLLCRL